MQSTAVLRALPWFAAAGVAVAAIAATSAASSTPVLPLLLVGALAAVVLVPAVLPALRRNLWCAPLIASLALMLADPTAAIASDTTLRYLPVVAVLALTVAAFRWSQRVSMPRVLVLVLALAGTIGALVGRIALGVDNGVLPIMLPALVAVLPARAGAYPFRSERGVAVTLSLLGSAVMVVASVARLGLAGFSFVAVNHEQAFIGVLAFAAAVAARSTTLAVVAAATTALAYSTYPAATFLVAGIAGAGTVLAAPLLSRFPTIRRATGAVVFAAVMLVSTNLAGVIRGFGAYFRAVGKIDNGSTRLQIESAALERMANPIFGSFFSGDVTVLGKLSGRDVVVPVHNDYLAIALAGGYAGLALFVGFLVLVNGAAFRSLPRLEGAARRLDLALLAAFNAAAVSSFANPVLMKPSATLIVFALGAAVLAMRPSKLDVRAAAVGPPALKESVPEPAAVSSG